MYIITNPEHFVPKNFVILNFYGKDTCFAWSEAELVCFTYSFGSTTERLKVLQAPAKINKIRSYNGRVFIVCHPCGIYKLKENLDIVILSKTGIELGSEHYEVFTHNNGVLVLDDKKHKISNKLFSCVSTTDVNVLSISYDTDNILCKTLQPGNSNSNGNLCLVTHEKNLYKMSSQTIQIIYGSDYLIKNIYPVEKGEKIVGAILQTDTDVVILMHVVNDKLKYDKISLGIVFEAMCGFINTGCDDILILIYSDGTKTYYTRKLLTKDSSQETTIEETYYNSFKLYQSKYIIYLNDFKELIQVSNDRFKEICSSSSSNYVKLQPNMLRGLEKTIEDICCKTEELRSLREEVAEKEDKLKRINIFVNKQRMKCCPEDSVVRLLNQKFLVSNFRRDLMENSTVVKMLKSGGKTIFVMKKVKNYDTVVEMPIGVPNLSSKLYTTSDLITYKDDEGAWCLIKNYIEDPLPSRSNKVHLTSEKLDLIKYKLVVLKNLLKGNNLTIEALSNIKRDIRQEIDLQKSHV